MLSNQVTQTCSVILLTGWPFRWWSPPQNPLPLYAQLALSLYAFPLLSEYLALSSGLRRTFITFPLCVHHPLFLKNSPLVSFFKNIAALSLFFV